MTKFVYFFGGGKAEGHKDMKDAFGGKGAGLAEMTNAGLPVPPGFTISTKACAVFEENKGALTPAIDDEISEALAKLETLMGKSLGQANDPLLVSVRSGSKFSMPGMMDTILNLGLNDKSVIGLKTKTGNGRFAKDSYRRFIQMYSNVVLNIDKNLFEHELHAVKKTAKDPCRCRSLGRESGRGHRTLQGGGPEADRASPSPRIRRNSSSGARDAVFRSWGNPRAVTYRRLNDIPHDLGTAVNVQCMVFGNKGDTSATGVGFTRNPSTGAREFYGEFLQNAQGEDVVAGIRTPHPIADLQQLMPAAYKQLREITTRLERHYKDIQDFEFTIEENKLFMLQTRNGKRTGLASVVIAVDLVEEGILTKPEALLKVEPQSLDQLLHPIFEPKERGKAKVAANGLPASPGAATGAVVFTADDAVAWAHKGKRVVLVRMETVPDDIHGMHVAQGILTATGGMTSHAAVVGRQMGKPSVVGCSALSISAKKKTMTVGDKVVREGDVISIDGSTGEVMLQALATSPSEILQVVNGTLKAEKSPIYQKFAKLLSWTDDVKRLGIRANADIPKDAKTAFAFGAQGIGLCRTEHMFFAEERLPHVVAMILAAAKGEKGMAVLRTLEKKLADANSAQKKNVKAELNGGEEELRSGDQAVPGRPQEADADAEERLRRSLPRDEGLSRHHPHPRPSAPRVPPEARGPHGPGRGPKKGSKAELARAEKMLHEIESLHEFNPMLGHRGCRLGITYPEITRMQARAIFEAALQVAKKGIKVRPEIMIPLVGHVEELKRQKAIVLEEAHRVLGKDAAGVEYLIGTMIEVPRAAVTADEIAKEAEFFSFGTNDLTQMGFGLSRDDAGKFLGPYVEMGILEKDPFVSIDVLGVGQLVDIAVKKGRATKPDLKIGVCGEHGGDPSSIRFFHNAGLNYVSASPFRIPIARLAAAQAQLEKPNAD